MTDEHRILHLLDRGTFSPEDLSLLIKGSRSERNRLERGGLIEFTRGGCMMITSAGIERLNSLDEAALTVNLQQQTWAKYSMEIAVGSEDAAELDRAHRLRVWRGHRRTMIAGLRSLCTAEASDLRREIEAQGDDPVGENWGRRSLQLVREFNSLASRAKAGEQR